MSFDPFYLCRVAFEYIRANWRLDSRVGPDIIRDDIDYAIEGVGI